MRTLSKLYFSRKQMNGMYVTFFSWKRGNIDVTSTYLLNHYSLFRPYGGTTVPPACSWFSISEFQIFNLCCLLLCALVFGRLHPSYTKTYPGMPVSYHHLHYCILFLCPLPPAMVRLNGVLFCGTAGVIYFSLCRQHNKWWWLDDQFTTSWGRVVVLCIVRSSFNETMGLLAYDAHRFFLRINFNSVFSADFWSFIMYIDPFTVLINVITIFKY